MATRPQEIKNQKLKTKMTDKNAKIIMTTAVLPDFGDYGTVTRRRLNTATRLTACLKLK